MPLKALVTGGSRGIGLAVARRLASLDYEVWIAARSPENLALAQAQARHEGLNLRPIALDVADPASVATGFATMVSQMGAAMGPEPPAPLDVLVHAAGIGAYSDIQAEADPALWSQVLNVNLTGAYHCARAALGLMPGPGRIVFVSSVLGLRGMSRSHAYCASKHGVIGLMRALALDLAAKGITVNAICPGWVETEMAKNDMSAMAAAYGLEPAELESSEIGAVPIGRWIQPGEVAELAAYLVSPAAAALTGQALELSGGL